MSIPGMTDSRFVERCRRAPARLPPQLRSVGRLGQGRLRTLTAPVLSPTWTAFSTFMNFTERLTNEVHSL
jgi:hypothetical protein